MAKINKKELVEALAEEAYISIKDAQTICNSMVDIVKSYLKEGISVNIPNFGSFVPLTKSSRTGTDPNTHKQITIVEKKSVTFHPSNGFKKELNK